MKIILLTVSSIDGKLTKWTGSAASKWSSKEDFAHFQKVRSQNNLIVMGSGTFNVVRDYEKAGLKPEKERLRVILTSKPTRYKEFAVPGQMEFSDETPRQLVTRLEKEGFTQMLLVSGGRVAASFLKEQLIDELWLTIEPQIFGLGELMVPETKLDIALQLLKTQKLNTQGTLLLKYNVRKS